MTQYNSLNLLGLVILLVLHSMVLYRPAHAQSEGFEAAIRATLTQHPSLSSKRSAVAAKGYVVESVRTQRLPTMSAQVAVQDDGSQPGSVRARQPLWAFGRIDSAIAFADVDVLVEQADLNRLQRQLMDQTAVAYARIWGIRQRLRVAKDNVSEMDKLYQQIQRREQGQLASQADVRLALARWVQARAQQNRFEGELIVALAELHALTQAPVISDQPIPDSFIQLPATEEVHSLAQLHSADIHLGAQRVLLSEADVKREQVAPMPTIFLQADHNFNQSNLGNNTRVGVVFEGSLEGMGFAAAGRGKAARSRLLANQDDLVAMRNETRRSVSNLYSNRDLQQDLINSQALSVGELSEILASYQRQYQSGHKAWQDVLNMQRELSEQRLQQVQAENDWLVFTLKLVILIGGLDSFISNVEE